MRRSNLALASAVVALCAVQPALAAPSGKSQRKPSSALSVESDGNQPKFAPVPDWVTSQPVPKSLGKNDRPFELLLTNSQEYLTPGGVENFIEYVVQPLTQAGLQAFGNIALPWNVYRTDLTIHQVSIERDGKVIDVLDKSNISVIRRETQLERATLTGLRTVIMPVKGLRVGDQLRVAFTYTTKPNRIGKTEEIQDMDSAVPISRMVRRLVVSKDLPVRWKTTTEVKPVVTETDKTAEKLFVVEKFEPPKKRKFVPDRLSRHLIQVSSFNSWDEVAAPMIPLFDKARQTKADSEVSKLADKIAADHKGPHERLLAALRESQDQVRYVALLLGDGDYSPMTADEVWEQRFGDCKGKTAFLLALLDRLGIEAEPMLASMKYDDGLDEALPTLAIFDHVIVRAHVGSETYYLDGTNFGQRTVEELKQSPTTNGLPLVAGTKLIQTPDILPSSPLKETVLVWDASKGVTEKTPFEATLILRGETAAEMRAEAAVSSNNEKLTETLKEKVDGVSNDDLEFVSSEPNAPDGSYIARFKGKVALDWTPVEGKKGNRFQLSQSTVSWDPEFDRDDDAAKGIPVSMAFPYWERTVEKVVLPNGGKDFLLDATPIDEKIAVTHISRTVSMSGGVVTAVSDFRRLERELDANTARSSKEALEKINDDYAYVVSRKKLKIVEGR